MKVLFRRMEAWFAKREGGGGGGHYRVSDETRLFVIEECCNRSFDFEKLRDFENFKVGRFRFCIPCIYMSSCLGFCVYMYTYIVSSWLCVCVC